MDKDTLLERKLYQHYTNCSGHSMEVLWPYYCHGKQHLLKEHERLNFIRIYLMTMVKQIEVDYFKKDQFYAVRSVSDAIDYRYERVLIFLELSKVLSAFRWEGNRWVNYKSLGYVITEFKRAFSRYEAVLQMRRLGLSTLHPTKERNVYQVCHCKYVTAFIDIQIKNRLYPDEDWFTFYCIRYKKVPEHKVFARYLARVQTIEFAILESGGLNDYWLVGFTTRNQDLETTMEFENI